MLDLNSIIDFADEAEAEIGKFRVGVILSPSKMRFGPYCVPNLNWQSVKYGDAEVHLVPDDKRGVYAFAICEPSAVLPPHGYILYIGIAGRNSTRSLRARYMDYLNARKVKKRSRIAQMIGTWHEVLRFFFVPVDDAMTSDDLESLEKQLNTALLPPFSEGDLDAETKIKRRAFR